MPLAPEAQRAPEPDAVAVDFTVSSSLPPMVVGPLAGELELSVPCLYPKPGVLCSTRYLRDRQRQPMFAVRMMWWGDGGPGTVLKPTLLSGRDEGGEMARRVRPSKATCALFPVRCGLDGLVAYLKDMGSIALEVLVHEGGPRGARLVGRCVIPVGSWGRKLDTHSGSGESDVVVEGYFPVLSLDGNRYAGDLRVRLRACLGSRSKLRGVVALGKMAVDNARMGGEPQGALEALHHGGAAPPAGIDQNAGVQAGIGLQEELSKAWRSEPGSRRSREGGGLPARASFDSSDLSSGSSEGSLVTNTRHPRGSAQNSSFQLNEALANFDASDTLPIWPAPKGSLYHPPETHGEAPPTPRGGQASRGRLAVDVGAGVSTGAANKLYPAASIAKGRVGGIPPTRVGMALSATTRIPTIAKGVPSSKRKAVKEGTGQFATSLSPERQAPNPNPGRTGEQLGARDVGHEKTRAGVIALPSGRPESPLQHAPSTQTSKASNDDDDTYLSELFNRGKDLRDKMAFTSGSGGASLTSETPAAPRSQVKSSIHPVGANRFAGLAAQPGLVSGAPLGSSLRDDIEGIFDTLSDDGRAADEAGVLVRDPETRGHEDRMVNLLLEAAGPPPSSLAFPALAAVERRRADSMARVRFLRIRLSRLVMFGSMASSAEGHGWQLRFRLPAFATPPGRGSAGGRKTAARAGGGEGRGKSRDARVVSLPVPPRVPRVSASSRGRAKAAASGRGRSASGAVGSAASVLRVRRGFGASDLVMGETPLLEEMVCAVDVDDTCVRRWMDTTVEFLLVDGKTDGASRARSGQPKTQPHKGKPQQRTESLTVGAGDRVAAVATLPLRDLLLSAELGVAATLDLVEVSDFWAAEDARVAAAGIRGRKGRPLRNPNRENAPTAARPLVLGDRAVGALAVALELVPGEKDVSPEHSRPEVEHWLKSRWYQGVEKTEACGEGTERAGGAGGEGGLGLGKRNDEEFRWEASLEQPLVGAAEEQGASPPLQATKKPEDVGVNVRKVAALGSPAEEKDEMGELCGHGESPTAPPVVRPPEFEGSLKKESRDLAIVTVGVDCSVVLRIEDLRLSPDMGPGVEHVRVAYSFTQVEGRTPTVTHRSVCGSRGQAPGPNGEQPLPSFAFDHQETFPAPADSSTWRRGENASRVFEIWGGCAEGHTAGSGGVGLGGVLIGLAKVSLRAFAAFGSNELRSETAGVTDLSLAVAADGPVVVVDPFSGRAVGELRVFLALGASPSIDALSAVGKRGGRLELPLNRLETAAGRGGHEKEGGGEEQEEEQKALEDGGGRGGFGGEDEERPGKGGVMGDMSANLEPPALDDSMEALSMLLNPGWARKVETSTARSSGGFAGLVRHVVELSAVGELPVALEADASGEVAADEPVGCVIEYSLPTGQASLDTEGDGDFDPTLITRQAHELWWDGDSGILNSRARHTIKINGDAVDKLSDGPTDDPRNAECGSGSGGGGASAPEDRSLNGLLDCVFGREDVVLTLFWSSGEAGAGQRESQHRHDGHEEAGADGGIEHRLLGKAVLRREDLLPLVRRTSARVVLRLPIEPASADGVVVGGLRPPETLPLSISYRREPSAVARRKSRVSSGRREAKEGTIGDVLYGRKDIEGSPQEVGVGLMRDVGQARGEGHLGGENAFDSSFDANPSREGEEDAGSETREGRLQGGTLRKPLPSHRQGVASPEGSVDEGASVRNDSRGSWESERKTLGNRSPKTDHLLPARTTLCVHVKSVSWTASSTMAAKGEGFLWASFDFPGHGGYGGEERKRGEVFVWQPGAGVDEAKRENGHWSPPVVVKGGESVCDRVPLEWRVEIPVAIDAAFVEFMHTRSLELRVWRGARDDWPTAGTACGAAKVALRSLLTTLKGVDGDVAVTPEGGRGSGSVVFHLFFKHRGFGSTDADLEQRAGHVRGCEDREVEHRVPEPLREEAAVVRREGPSDADGLDAVHGVGAVTASGQLLGWSDSLSRTQKDVKVQPPLPEPSGGKLKVYIERAMRLLSATGGGTEPGASSETLPSTYVTFRWEEGGKPPLRSPLVLSPAAAGGANVGNTEAWQGATPGDWEAVTPLVANTSSPVFDHAAELHLTSPEAWGRVCSRSAALVFRVWRRARCSWWDDPQSLASDRPCDDVSGGDKGAGVVAAAAAAAAGSRLGDKLIGSAMVGLEVLLGSFAPGEGLGLREIDGWYHVLDDLRRPQGQIKVKVCPQPPAPASDQELQEPQALGHASTFPAEQREAVSEFEQLLSPATIGPLPASGATASGDREDLSDCDAWTGGSGASPPLDDTQAHLRAVHALLDSLPAEFRSAHRPSPPPPPPPPPPPLSALSSSLMPEEGALKFPSLCEEPVGAAGSHVAAPLSGDMVSTPGSATAGRCGGCEPSSLPELRRMLLSLDRVDRRLFALNSSVNGAVDAAEGVGSECVDGGGGEPKEQEIDDSHETGRVADTTGPSMEETTVPEQTQVMDVDADKIVNLAASTLQRVWRVWSKKRREEAAAEAERKSCALRERRRDEAAAKIQAANRRAQARHRVKAAAEERRRQEDSQRCRRDACATLERAWKAFGDRRRASRELVEARSRAAAAARKAEVIARSATVIQVVWRGVLGRAAARRLSLSRAKPSAEGKVGRGGAHGAVSSVTMPVYRNLLQPVPLDGERLAGAATTPRPLPFVMPSTFYNQLSQDPRRRHRLPDAHLAATETLPSAALPPALAISALRAVDGGMVETKEKRPVLPSARFGPRPLAQSAGAAVRPPRFADLETARIARIMNGNLQHWAGVRSGGGGGGGGSSSSDDFDL